MKSMHLDELKADMACKGYKHSLEGGYFYQHWGNFSVYLHYELMGLEVRLKKSGFLLKLETIPMQCWNSHLNQ